QSIKFTQSFCMTCNTGAESRQLGAGLPGAGEPTGPHLEHGLLGVGIFLLVSIFYKSFHK
ncbi:hypothetical protein, partial [Streptomyces sp. Mg1]|uniref:hypothetical protein n=1 Tax=Streptomyces sp. Mg1 TaxID=465541 RepID=UPI001F3BD9E1